MCGILVAYNPEGTRTTKGIAQSALAKIKHRGPDQIGEWSNEFWYFGSTRLAVTGGEESRQPVISPDGRYVCVFNGEIYNFENLRSTLRQKSHSFSTKGDTEVIMMAFLEWGVEAFSMFEGQYSILILNTSTNELFIARDRFGEKPLYYKISNNGVFFSSELSPIIEMSGNKVQLKSESILQFLANWYVQDPNTIFQDIFAVPPNTFLRLVVSNSTGQVDLEFGKIHASKETKGWKPQNFEDALGYFEEQLVKSVLLTYPKTNFPALMLSGGLDSSLIAGILKRKNYPFQAFTTTLENSPFDESTKVAEIANFLDIPVTEVAISNPSMNEIREINAQLDMPIGEASFLAGHASAKIIRQHGHNVVLLGDGGDEILGGYPTYIATSISSRTPKNAKRVMKLFGNFLNQLPLNIEHNSSLDRLTRFLFFQNDNALMSHLLWRSNVDLLGMKGSSNAKLLASIENYEKIFYELIEWKENDLLLTAMRLDRTTWLGSGNLMKNDRAFMLHGIENRTPYLTSSFASAMDSIPSEFKLRKWKTKVLSRELSKKYLGNIMNEHSKAGWSFPLRNWFLEMEDDASDMMKDSFLLNSSPELSRLYNGKQLGIQGSYRFKWALLMLESWLQTRKYTILWP